MVRALAIRAEPKRNASDLRRLWDDHAERLRALLANLLGPGHDPDDLLQEVFVLAWRKLDRFDGLRPFQWLSQIAIRRACAWRRLARFRRFLSLDPAPEPVEWETPEQSMETAEATALAYAILDRMSEKRRTVLILYEIEGLSGKEIAEALGCPLKTVHTRLYHARRELVARYEAATAGAAGRGAEGRR